VSRISKWFFNIRSEFLFLWKKIRRTKKVLVQRKNFLNFEIFRPVWIFCCNWQVRSAGISSGVVNLLFSKTPNVVNGCLLPYGKLRGCQRGFTLLLKTLLFHLCDPTKGFETIYNSTFLYKVYQLFNHYHSFAFPVSKVIQIDPHGCVYLLHDKEHTWAGSVGLFFFYIERKKTIIKVSERKESKTNRWVNFLWSIFLLCTKRSDCGERHKTRNLT